MKEIIEYINPKKFLNNCETFLEENESKNNLIIGLARAISKQGRKTDNLLLFCVRDNNTITGAGIRTNQDKPLSLFLSDERDISLVISHLKKNKYSIAGIISSLNISEKFAQEYCLSYKVKSHLQMHQGIYQADKIVMPNQKNTEIVLATDKYKKHVQLFLEGFITDCFPNERGQAKKNAEVMCERHIRNKTLYLLKNNDLIVSMAANNRETKNTACVSLVYTPLKYRGNGYASIVTARVSQLMLDNGKKYCNLFTNLENPTSNSIYRKIGYQLIGESKHFSFSG